MDERAKQFYHDFRQSLAAQAEASGDFLAVEFVRTLATVVEDSGFVDQVEISYYKAERGSRVDGYCLGDDGVLSLFIADFGNRTELEKLSGADAIAAFKRVSNFYRDSREKPLYQELEEASQGYQLARLIYDRRAHIRKVEFHLLSERTLSTRMSQLDTDPVSGTLVNYNVWDMSRLQRIEESRGRKEPVDIDLSQDDAGGLPCIPAHLASSTYESYLVVVPGDRLAKLYENYGARLLEQNVRTFLQARGNVNKGIQSTILNEPDMFFAYNNGITATAESVVLAESERGTFIERIRDLQIVNGGQTTASLFHTSRKYKVPLTGVFVQMKLSVVDPERSDEIVPKISEYANTQNRVNAADFFSNHPFHRRMEEFSRRIWVPTPEGQLRSTKWFYERARGQYADAQSSLTAGEKARFKTEFPQNQRFTKTDLAKFENVWDDHPRWVNLGAQKNFARFAQRVGKLWEQDDYFVNEFYYRRAIARAILFRRAERVVSTQPWYNGGYRANIVAYALASLSSIAAAEKRPFDFEPIWRKQGISDTTEEALSVAAQFVNQRLVNPPRGVSNVSEWAKQEACWERIHENLDELRVALPQAFFSSLGDGESTNAQKREARKTQRVDLGIKAQSRVVSIPVAEWKRIQTLASSMKLLSPKEESILALVCSMPSKIPSEAQSQAMLAMLSRLKSEGVAVEEE